MCTLCLVVCVDTRMKEPSHAHEYFMSLTSSSLLTQGCGALTRACLHLFFNPCVDFPSRHGWS